MIKAINRKTGAEVIVTRAEDGKYNVEGKAYAASTFKKYFKVTGEISSQEDSQEIEVFLYTFTGMKIQGTFKAVLDNSGVFHVDTKKKGELLFSKDDMKQINCKNSKFANSIKRV